MDVSSASRPLRLRQHKVPTCAVLTPDGRYLFTTGKDGSINKWDVYKNKHISKIQKLRPEASASGSKKGKEKAHYGGADIQGHTDEVYALAVSDDGKYLVSGGKDRRVVVWGAKAKELTWVKSFGGHKDSITVSPKFYTEMYKTHFFVYRVSLSAKAHTKYTPPPSTE